MGQETQDRRWGGRWLSERVGARRRARETRCGGVVRSRAAARKWQAEVKRHSSAGFRCSSFLFLGMVGSALLAAHAAEEKVLIVCQAGDVAVLDNQPGRSVCCCEVVRERNCTVDRAPCQDSGGNGILRVVSLRRLFVRRLLWHLEERERRPELSEVSAGRLVSCQLYWAEQAGCDVGPLLRDGAVSLSLAMPVGHTEYRRRKRAR